MVGFYKHDIPDWMDGTEKLSDGAYRAYHVIVQLIMLNEGPITRNDRGIAGRCNQTVKAFGKHLQELINARKILVEDGRLFNTRAGIELDFVFQNRENAGKGGRTPKNPAKTRGNPKFSQENPRTADLKLLIDNDKAKATLSEAESLREERREEDIEPPQQPRGGGGRAPVLRKIAIPLTFAPDRQGMQCAIEHGMTREIMPRQVQRFIDMNLRNANTSADWQADWRAWCRQYLNFEQEAAARRANREQPPVRRSSGSTNGFSELAERKANGDGSVYRKAFGHLDDPRDDAGRGDDDPHGSGGHNTARRSVQHPNGTRPVRGGPKAA